MIETELYTTRGAYLTSVMTPQSKAFPILIWQNRAFEKRANRKYYEIEALQVWTREEYEEFNHFGISNRKGNVT